MGTKSIKNAKAREFLMERAANAGATAAVRRRPYSENPHTNDAGLKLAWSEAHSGMRARMILDAEGMGALS